MITKIQNKPLYVSLVAMVLAITLALGGIGTALGAPDEGQGSNEDNSWASLIDTSSSEDISGKIRGFYDPKTSIITVEGSITNNTDKTYNLSISALYWNSESSSQNDRMI